MSQAGEIRKLRLQQNFTLQEGYTDPDGTRIRAIVYKADFTYERREWDADGKERWAPVVEDVKTRPTRTKDYLIKKKLMKSA